MECGNGEGRRDDLEELTQDKTLIVNSGLPQIMDCLKVGGKSAERNYTDHEKKHQVQNKALLKTTRKFMLILYPPDQNHICSSTIAFGMQSTFLNARREL